MRAGVLALIVGVSFVLPLRSDLRIRVRDTFANRSTTRVEYYKDTRSRTDASAGGGAYRIVDSANKRILFVDPVKREFWIYTSTSRKPRADPSRTIVVEVEGHDTGEQRQIFGYPARHFITVQRQHTEYTDKPPSETQEIVTDGWYLDVPFPLPAYRHGIGVYTALVADQYHRDGAPKIKITRLGSTPKGLPVWQKTGDSLMEVTEFSEAELDPKLFEPPVGFRRVIRPMPGDQLPWSDQALFYWQQLQDWLVSWF